MINKFLQNNKYKISFSLLKELKVQAAKYKLNITVQSEESIEN